ncbi:MAG: hypothetical protein M0C28_45400 [Candidatus Moduliflexus flocculans]|nr:hypothetical protein [Candidatus Moduliflexus flocculans]
MSKAAPHPGHLPRRRRRWPIGGLFRRSRPWAPAASGDPTEGRRLVHHGRLLPAGLRARGDRQDRATRRWISCRSRSATSAATPPSSRSSAAPSSSGPSRSVLEMTFQGVEDWAIVEVWFKGEEGREIRRTILYVLTGNAWKAGDSGRLAD